MCAGMTMRGVDETEPKRFARRYPWEEWFGSGSTTLVQGLDFDCSILGMRQNAIKAARTKLPTDKRLRIDVGIYTLTISVVSRDKGKKEVSRG